MNKDIRNTIEEENANVGGHTNQNTETMKRI
jgi:hypothetical protein